MLASTGSVWEPSIQLKIKVNVVHAGLSLQLLR